MGLAELGKLVALEPLIQEEDRVAVAIPTQAKKSNETAATVPLVHQQMIAVVTASAAALIPARAIRAPGVFQAEMKTAQGLVMDPGVGVVGGILRATLAISGGTLPAVKMKLDLVPIRKETFASEERFGTNPKILC